MITCCARRVELGRAYKRLGQHARARRELEAALAMDVEDINAHLQKARPSGAFGLSILVRRGARAPVCRELRSSALPVSGEQAVSGIWPVLVSDKAKSVSCGSIPSGKPVRPEERKLGYS